MGIWDRLTGAEAEREREGREAAEAARAAAESAQARADAAKAKSDATAQRLRERLTSEVDDHRRTQNKLDEARGDQFKQKQDKTPPDPRLAKEQRYREAGGHDSRPTR
ncbi:hypothetical protein DFJ68_2246 [Terracoccus luteus]|uniref:Uncharacterized protein n=1 Tax=Terracoccus luteus TaxID=53356 RepID=A0A495Y0X6_9MICO|nr:hypothetical protein [Terracoccus luteus]RKT78794.1 hypothetical protein DFJ68_2246 [Terracoccus luteus]